MMSDDGIMIFMNEDGVFEKYDDTWDLVIHCESEEEHNEAVEWMKKSGAKEVIFVEDEFMNYYECPNCGYMISTWKEDDHEHCPKCGQKVDWSE